MLQSHEYIPLDPAFFPGRVAAIYYRAPENMLKSSADKVESTSPIRDREIGVIGILHPLVLSKFEINYPCSALELELEPFKKEVTAVWTNA